MYFEFSLLLLSFLLNIGNNGLHNGD